LHLTRTIHYLSGQQKYKQFGELELISGLRNYSDRNCLGELYNRFGHLVFGVSLKVLGNTEESEDLTMNLFMSIEEKIKKHEIKHFKSWLYRVTLNECYMILRKRKTHQETTLNEHQDLIEIIEDNNSMNLDCFEINLHNGMNQLKTEHKRALELFYQEEMSYTSISKTLGWDLNTVKSYIQNGKRNLRIILQKLCNEK